MALASVSHAPGFASRIWKYSTPPIGHTDLAARFFAMNVPVLVLWKRQAISRGPVELGHRGSAAVCKAAGN